jgi:hypothetical protein
MTAMTPALRVDVRHPSTGGDTILSDDDGDARMMVDELAEITEVARDAL